jgi:hypothetical protein
MDVRWEYFSGISISNTSQIWFEDGGMLANENECLSDQII